MNICGSYHPCKPIKKKKKITAFDYIHYIRR